MKLSNQEAKTIKTIIKNQNSQATFQSICIDLLTYYKECTDILLLENDTDKKEIEQHKTDIIEFNRAINFINSTNDIEKIYNFILDNVQELSLQIDIIEFIEMIFDTIYNRK